MPGNPIPQSLYSNAYYHPHIACIQSVLTQLPPVSACYHAECERLATAGAQRGNVFGFCHHYILLEHVYVYNTYTLQYVLLQ
jgi:hypothetical protein